MAHCRRASCCHTISKFRRHFRPRSALHILCRQAHLTKKNHRTPDNTSELQMFQCVQHNISSTPVPSSTQVSPRTMDCTATPIMFARPSGRNAARSTLQVTQKMAQHTQKWGHCTSTHRKRDKDVTKSFHRRLSSSPHNVRTRSNTGFTPTENEEFATLPRPPD
eukprot:SAG31_NODE_915_length_11052_cov_26.254633_7_plen_164_part_00